VTLGADTAVTATFSLSHASIAGVLYHTIQEAYDAASDGAVIQVRDLSLIESFTADSILSKAVTVNGGCNSDYSICTGVTLLKGMITTSKGRVIIKNFSLQK
jgi:hypothetical protein